MPGKILEWKIPALYNHFAYAPDELAADDDQDDHDYYHDNRAAEMQ